MDERLRFVAQLLDGETMSEVCRSFGISRKTGYKIFNRYKEQGLDATYIPFEQLRRNATYSACAPPPPIRPWRAPRRKRG